MPKFEIRELPGRLAVARLAPFAETPLWAASGAMSAIVRTSEELSIVCAADSVPFEIQAERDWIALQLKGPIPLAAIGVLASLLAPLACAAIPVFVVSTFDTDYILVKAENLQCAIEHLRNQGHSVQANPAF